MTTPTMRGVYNIIIMRAMQRTVLKIVGEVFIETNQRLPPGILARQHDTILPYPNTRGSMLCSCSERFFRYIASYILAIKIIA